MDNVCSTRKDEHCLIDKIFKQIRKKDRKREELEFGTSQLVFLYSEKDTSW